MAQLPKDTLGGGKETTPKPKDKVKKSYSTKKKVESKALFVSLLFLMYALTSFISYCFDNSTELYKNTLYPILENTEKIFLLCIILVSVIPKYCGYVKTFFYITSAAVVTNIFCVVFKINYQIYDVSSGFILSSMGLLFAVLGFAYFVLNNDKNEQ